MNDDLDLAIEDSTPEELTPVTSEILVLPGHLFFIETTAVPEELESAEIKEFAELNLESTAPFPIDQLFWGFLQTEGSTRILIYATHRDRLKNSGYADYENYTWVLPDFATLYGAQFPEDTSVLLKTEHCLSLIHFKKDSHQPLGIVCRPTGSSRPEEDVITTLHTLLPEAPRDVEPLAIQPERTELGENEETTFHFKTAEEGLAIYDIGDWAKLAPSTSKLWQADIRSSDYKETERKNRRLSKILSKIAGWTTIAALALVAFEIALLGGRAWLGTKESRILSQEPTVLRILNQQSLIEKLDQVALNEMRPIDMLEALNNVRPKGIYFTSTITNALNQITVNGVANTVSDFNRYITKLDNSGHFKLAGDPKSVSRKGTTTFSVTLTYEHSDESDTGTSEAAQTSEEAKI